MNGFIVTGDDTPQLRKLLTNIVEQYAVHWEELGRKLGLKDHHLANIAENTANREYRRVETCSKRVFEKWLQLDPSPTWGKLDDVIKSLTMNPMSPSHKGMTY